MPGVSFRVEARRAVAHPPARVWELLTDHAGYARVAPTISKVEVLAGSGHGMVRHCTDTRGKGWTETCDLWEDGRRFRMKVDTRTYPVDMRVLFSSFQGEWAVESLSPGSEIILRFEGTLRGGPLARPLRRRFETLGQLLADEVLDGYEQVLGSGST